MNNFSIHRYGLSPAAFLAAAWILLSLFHLRPWRLSHGYVYHGDDQGYLAHLSTVVIDRDLDYANEFPWRHYPPGSAWLSLPGYAAGYLLDVLLHNRESLVSSRNYAFTWTIVGYLLNQAILVVMGLVLLWRLIASLQVNRTVATGAVLAVMTSHLAMYSFRRPMAHDAEFLLNVLFLIWWINVLRSPRFPTFRSMLGGGLISGFIVVTRWNDFHVVGLGALAVLYRLIASSEYGTEPVPFRMAGRRLVAYLISAVVIFLALQGPVWKGQFGAWFPALPSISPAQGRLEQPLSWESLRYLAVVFGGLGFGLLWTAPIIPLGIAAGSMNASSLFPQVSHSKRLLFMAAALIGFYGLAFFIVMQWRTQGSYYGYRYLTSTLPVSALFAALWVNRHFQGRKRALLSTAGSLAILLAAGTAIPFEGNASTLTLSIGSSYGRSGWLNPRYSLEAWKALRSPFTMARALAAGPLGVPAGLALQRRERPASSSLIPLKAKYEPFQTAEQKVFLVLSTVLLMLPAVLFLLAAEPKGFRNG